MTLHVKCPTCQRDVIWNSEAAYRPFCSRRCQLIDLGEWADESHRIPGESTVQNNDEIEHPYRVTIQPETGSNQD